MPTAKALYDSSTDSSADSYTHGDHLADLRRSRPANIIFWIGTGASLIAGLRDRVTGATWTFSDVLQFLTRWLPGSPWLWISLTLVALLIAGFHASYKLARAGLSERDKLTTRLKDQVAATTSAETLAHRYADELVHERGFHETAKVELEQERVRHAQTKQDLARARDEINDIEPFVALQYVPSGDRNEAAAVCLKNTGRTTAFRTEIPEFTYGQFTAWRSIPMQLDPSGPLAPFSIQWKRLGDDRAYKGTFLGFLGEIQSAHSCQGLEEYLETKQYLVTLRLAISFYNQHGKPFVTRWELGRNLLDEKQTVEITPLGRTNGEAAMPPAFLQAD